MTHDLGLYEHDPEAKFLELAAQETFPFSLKLKVKPVDSEPSVIEVQGVLYYFRYKDGESQKLVPTVPRAGIDNQQDLQVRPSATLPTFRFLDTLACTCDRR